MNSWLTCASRSSFAISAIVSRGAERHGACVTPRSGCHELFGFFVAGLMSEPHRGLTLIAH